MRSYRSHLFGLLAVASLVCSGNFISRADTLTGCAERIAGGGRTSTANFALMAFYDPTTETFRGALHYADRAAGIQVTSSELTDYGVVSPDTRILSYALTGGTYDEARVVVTDGGHGPQSDSIELQLFSNGNLEVQVPATVAGGNLILHADLCH